MKPEDDYEAKRQEFNARLRREWPQFADGFHDPATLKDGKPEGFYFKRALTENERNAFGRYLSALYGIEGVWLEPLSPVDIEALLREAQPL